MSLHGKRVNPLDHALRYALRRQAARLGAEPRPDARRRLLQRASARSLPNQWLALLRSVRANPAPDNFPWLELGWRELAFAQVVRPAGMYGSFAFQLR